MTVTTFPAPSRAETSAGIVARNLKRLMAERNIPQRLVADALQITQSNVSKRLKGTTRFTTDDLDALARAFDVHPSVLLSDAGQNWNAPAARGGEGNGLPRLDSNQQPAGRESAQVIELEPHRHRVLDRRRRVRRDVAVRTGSGRGIAASSLLNVA